MSTAWIIYVNISCANSIRRSFRFIGYVPTIPLHQAATPFISASIGILCRTGSRSELWRSRMISFGGNHLMPWCWMKTHRLKYYFDIKKFKCVNLPARTHLLQSLLCYVRGIDHDHICQLSVSSNLIRGSRAQFLQSALRDIY